ncbi:auxin transport protein (BIG) [Artemisia annua]|uniref:Auxin transport protein (BIG) n=1 Tax=Artemisia annua TaxID=35608 RepID=A0A2U1L9V2_ARTAN|nr:auxin transport protein (BIG) [Artemisia annua]
MSSENDPLNLEAETLQSFALLSHETTGNQKELVVVVLNLLMLCCKIREKSLIVESLRMEANESDNINITQNALTVSNEEAGAGEQAKEIDLISLGRLSHPLLHPSTTHAAARAYDHVVIIFCAPVSDITFNINDYNTSKSERGARMAKKELKKLYVQSVMGGLLSENEFWFIRKVQKLVKERVGLKSGMTSITKPPSHCSQQPGITT